MTIAPAAAAKLILATAQSTTAGAAVNLAVTAQDAYGNVATGYGGAKSLMFSGAQSSGGNPPTAAGVAFGNPTSITFAAGQATTVLKLYRAETAVISAGDGTVTSGGVTVSVAPGAASTLTLGVGSQAPTAGSATTLTLTAVDAYGNQATGYGGNKTLTFGGAQSIGASAPTIDGVAFGSTTTIAFAAGRATRDHEAVPGRGRDDQRRGRPDQK